MNGVRTWKTQKLGNGSDSENFLLAFIYTCVTLDKSLHLSASVSPIMTWGPKYLRH